MAGEQARRRRALSRLTMAWTGGRPDQPHRLFLSTALGRTIRYVDMPVQATRAARRARGVFQQLRGSAEALAAGEVAQVTDMVARLVGRPPRTFAELAHDLVAAA